MCARLELYPRNRACWGPRGQVRARLPQDLRKGAHRESRGGPQTPSHVLSHTPGHEANPVISAAQTTFGMCSPWCPHAWKQVCNRHGRRNHSVPDTPKRKVACGGGSRSWADPRPEGSFSPRLTSPLLISTDLFVSVLCSRATSSPCLCVSVHDSWSHRVRKQGLPLTLHIVIPHSFLDIRRLLPTFRPGCDLGKACLGGGPRLVSGNFGASQSPQDG